MSLPLFINVLLVSTVGVVVTPAVLSHRIMATRRQTIMKAFVGLTVTTVLLAAVGVAQLEKINNTLKRKRSIGGYYSEKLKTFQEFQIPFSKTDFAENIYWVFGVVLRSMETRDASWAIEKLKNRGVECRLFFLPMHQQPIFKKMGLFKNQRFPNAERIGKYGFYLPSGVALTKNQQRKVVNELINIVIGRE